jgi:hypothetical protein
MPHPFHALCEMGGKPQTPTGQSKNLLENQALCQGTTLVVPQKPQYKRWALAPEENLLSDFQFKRLTNQNNSKR